MAPEPKSPRKRANKKVGKKSADKAPEANVENIESNNDESSVKKEIGRAHV